MNTACGFCWKRFRRGCRRRGFDITKRTLFHFRNAGVTLQKNTQVHTTFWNMWDRLTQLKTQAVGMHRDHVHDEPKRASCLCSEISFSQDERDSQLFRRHAAVRTLHSPAPSIIRVVAAVCLSFFPLGLLRHQSTCLCPPPAKPTF